ncbi:hypothetical protein AA13595_1318 [Gluconacetobacter johannae DSM 13595]|nr:hypothetical protein AA13595_1318 [Gluconacetobacter johannae DSM 13595]
MAAGGGPEDADQPVRTRVGLPDRFFYTWPGNWEQLPAELTRFYTGWTRTEAEGLTGDELLAAVEDANRISEQQRKEAERGKRRR